MGKSKPMTPSAAARIQSATAKSSPKGGVTKGSFASRAQAAVAKGSKK